MLRRLLVSLTLFCAAFATLRAQSYNQLWIPDTLSGTVFNLSLGESTRQFRAGAVTQTYGINGNSYLGPTLIMRRGDSVMINVTNNLMDTTTVHWHGFHIPPAMDGGPHQPIAPGETWRPTFRIRNNAATFWYHPHLHMMTEQQMMMGLGGMIIVRDDDEAALALPRTYGVDDIPMILQDRRFDAGNQFVKDTYGDSMLVNGTLSAQTTVPAQVVRFRILNAAAERAYNLGFSDGRTFYVIGTDGGLLNAPAPVTRKTLGVGERIEILVDFSNASGSLDMMAYNGGQAMGFPGSEPAQSGPFGSALNNKTFRVLHLNVGAATSTPVTAIPTALAHNTYLDAHQAGVTRTVLFTEGFNRSPFHFDSTAFDMEVIDKVVRLNDVEIWELRNISAFSHTFHIHDVQFNILTRNGAAPKPEEAGWKDVVPVGMNETVRFITRFEDFADSTHPYMYHCHIGFHEDEGMMGQFVVVAAGASGVGTEWAAGAGASVAPNPTDGAVRLQAGEGKRLVRARAMNVEGRQALDVHGDAIEAIDLSRLPAGVYVLLLTNDAGAVHASRVIRR